MYYDPDADRNRGPSDRFSPILTSPALIPDIPRLGITSVVYSLSSRTCLALPGTTTFTKPLSLKARASRCSSLVGSEADCKTVIRRFESDPHLRRTSVSSALTLRARRSRSCVAPG